MRAVIFIGTLIQKCEVFVKFIVLAIHFNVSQLVHTLFTQSISELTVNEVVRAERSLC